MKTTARRHGPRRAAAPGTALADTTLKLVEVITSPQRTETLKGIVGQFEAANPGVKVEIISLPWGQAFEKFATMVSAGEMPDVVEMPDTWLALYANNGLLESLEPYLAKWEHTAELTDRALEFGRDVNDTAYMLPYGFYLRAMFYNKKLFKEAGVDEPAEDAGRVPRRRREGLRRCPASTATACAAARAASTAG